MNLFVFGSSILSSYWNGAATYYRGIYKELHRLGCDVTFAEPDAFGRQEHIDSEDFSFVTSVVYKPEEDLAPLLARAADADIVIKHSGIGVGDEILEAAVLECRRSHNRVLFWDVDAPATLASMAADPRSSLAPLIPRYDSIFTYGGGPPVVKSYRLLGARACLPIYNALDPETHYPVARLSDLACDLAFIGNRLPDREARVEQLFLRAAELAPELKFVLGGEGWGGKSLPQNVRWIGHVGTGMHNAVNCSARMVLNINRQSMANTGFSPPTRVFEAAGSGACLLCDDWPGIDWFFKPDQELLVVGSAEEIVDALRTYDEAACAKIGSAFRERALRDHTYAQRALECHTYLWEMLNGSSGQKSDSEAADLTVGASR